MSENFLLKCVRSPHFTWIKVINNLLPHTETYMYTNTHCLCCGYPFISPAAGLIKRADINKFTSLVSSLSLPTNTHRHTIHTFVDPHEAHTVSQPLLTLHTSHSHHVHRLGNKLICGCFTWAVLCRSRRKCLTLVSSNRSRIKMWHFNTGH